MLLIILVAGVAAGGMKVRASLLAAQSEANAGRARLLAGAELLKQHGVTLTKTDADEARADFQAAEVHFLRAKGTLDNSRLLGLLNLVPGVDRQLLASRKLADMGVHLARAGQLGTEAAGVMATNDIKKGPGEKILGVLDALDPQLGAISAELKLVNQDRQAIPKDGLLPPLAQAVAQFDAKLKVADLQVALSNLQTNEPLIRQILGSAGPRTYLVLQQDPAELRGTGGFIGSVGFLTFDHGRMAPFSPEDVYRIDGPVGGSPLGPPGSKNHIDAPYPLVKVFNVSSWSLRDSNWSPDFPTSARAAELMLDREAGLHVDGVIAIDPFFIARLLAVIGPTTVPPTNDVVTSANFYAVTLAKVHPEHGPAQGKSFLAQAAGAIFARLQAVPSNEWGSLLQAVQSGCSSRSLQAYFNDASAEGFVARSSCAGQLQPLKTDGLMVVESNIGGNKDDFWMKRAYTLRLAVQPDGRVLHTLSLHYEGLSSHGPVTGTWGYTGWLRIYLPVSSHVTFVNGASLDTTSELGRQLLQGWFYVQFNSAPTITVVYETDTAVVQPNRPSFELRWQKQAGRQADPIRVEITLPANWKLIRTELDHKTAPNPVTTDLSVDRDLQFWFQQN